MFLPSWRLATGSFLLFLSYTCGVFFYLLPQVASVQPLSAPTHAIEPRMVPVPAGLATIGCADHHINCEPDERVHKLYIDAFYIATHEVTNQEMIPFLNALGTHKRPTDKHPLLEIRREDQDSHILYRNGTYQVEPGFENYPVVEVSWYGATVYAQWLAAQTGKPYRLPTEAEWEYMARAGSLSQHPWGNTAWQGQANCDGCSGNWGDPDRLMPVGSFPANAWGIHDVLGNVWEWTCSAYDAHYTGAETRCVQGDPDDELVLRGGSWFNDPWDNRLSNRSHQQKWHQDYHSGFRLAMSGQ